MSKERFHEMSRVMNIARTDEISASDETVTDTLTYLAVYAILTRILYEHSKNPQREHPVQKEQP